MTGNGYEILTFRYSIVLLQREDRESEKLENVAEKIRTKICGKERYGVFVIGEKIVSGENVRYEIEKLYDVLQDCFYIGETQIIKGNRENIKRLYYTNEHHLLTTQLLQQVTTGKIQDLEKVYNKVFDFFNKNKVVVREMRYTLYALVNQIYQFNAESFDPVIECNRIMQQIYTSRDYEDAKRRIWKIVEILIVKTQAENEHQDSGFETYCRIVHFLNANISENYSLQEIADLFHISQPYLSKLFRKYKGGTYKEYCTNLKVQISIKLMKENPDLLIKDIAEKVGYDQLYFSTVFYRVMGEYPKQYRNRIEKE